MKTLRSSVAAMALIVQGCAVSVQGYESTSGGVRTTGATTSVQTAGRAGSVNGRATLVSPGGNVAGSALQAGVQGGAGLIVFLGILSAGIEGMLGAPREPLRGPMPTEAISETCSCYGYVPPSGGNPVAGH